MDVQCANTYTIQDIEALRVVVDPLRSQILELLIQKPQTVKQVADKLGNTPNKLYYHFSLLEKQGLITVTETRMVANMLEKIYQAVARHIDVDPSLTSFTTEEGWSTIHSLVTPVIDTTRADLVRSLQVRKAQHGQNVEKNLQQLFMGREVSHISEERVAEFSERLQALLHEFAEAGEGVPDGDSPSYALAIAFYPSFYYDSDDESTKTTE